MTSRKTGPRRLRLGIVFVLALVLPGISGCVSKPATTRSFIGLPTSFPRELRPPAPPLSAQLLGIGPMTVAGHLDRGYLPVRLEETRYEYPDSLRWGGTGARVMIQERMGELLIWATGAVDYRVFPWPVENAPPLAVELRVSRFEALPGGRVSLAAYWALRDGVDRRRLDSGAWEVELPVEGSGSGATVLALDRGLQELAVFLAERIRVLPEPSGDASGGSWP